MVKAEGFLALIAIGLIVVIIVLASGQKIGDIVVNEAKERNVISVSDSYTMEVEPDQVELYLNIETEALTALEAQQLNTQKSDSVIGVLKKNGIKNNEIETIGYYLNPKYNWENGKNELIGYTQRHSLKITTQRLDKVGDLIDVSTKAGVNDISSISYTLTNEKRDKVSSEALAKAAEKAKTKAQSLADSIGVKLGKVSSISESNVNYVPYTRSYSMAEKAEAGGAAPTIMPQNLQVTAYVSLSYEIS